MVKFTLRILFEEKRLKWDFREKLFQLKVRTEKKFLSSRGIKVTLCGRALHFVTVLIFFAKRMRQPQNSTNC